MKYHDPVMLREAIDAMNLKPGGIYVDATFGGGGHSGAIINRLVTGKLVAFDQDSDAEKNIISDKRFLFVKHNFIHLKRFLKYYNMIPVNGILADLGVSSHQFDEAERGFSFRFEGALDMRMNTRSRLTAASIVNEYPEEALATLFFEYGEVNNSRKLASVICAARKKEELKTIQQFTQAIRSCVFKEKENQYLAQVFQALRIEVNGELNALKQLLTQSAQVLSSGGRLVILSYHSLEDRLVKQFMSKGNFEGEAEKDIYGNMSKIQFRLISKKAVTASDDEISRNPRARSARMRIAEKI